MKIAFWSDYACPFCYIGERRLHNALVDLEILGSTPIIFKSFELDPTASRDVVSTTQERFAQKYGLSQEAAAKQIEKISAMGRAEGLDFRYSTTMYTNTFDALRLTKYAQEQGKNEIIEKLFDAYFTKNLQLSDHNVLVKIASECGLDAIKVTNILNSDDYASDVRKDEQEASMHGIHGVPFFLINDMYAISGAQPLDMLKANLAEILNHEKSYSIQNSGLSCGINGCKI